MIGIIVFVVQDFTGISSDPSLSWIGTVLSIVISAAIITVGHNEFKKNGEKAEKIQVKEIQATK